MPVRYQKWIIRQDLQASPEKIYVFGDNVARVGMGGQAKEMRGESNAFGLPTKWRPAMSYDAFFHDGDVEALAEIQKATVAIENILHQDKIVIVPLDGLGTGLSKLPEVAPLLYAYLWRTFDHWGSRFGDAPCPWEQPRNI